MEADRRTGEGRLRRDGGQTSLEWLGIGAVVVALLLAVVTLDAGRSVVGAVGGLVCRVAGAGCDAAGAGGPDASAPGGEGDDRAGAAGPQSGRAPGDGADDGQAGEGGVRGDGTLDADELAAIDAAIAGGDPAAIHAALDGLSPEEVAQAVAARTDALATTDGVPQDIRVAANRVRIEAHIAQLEQLLATLDPDDDGGILGAVEDLIEDANPIPDLVFGPHAPDTPAEQAALIRQRIAQLEGWIADDRQIIRFEPPTTPFGDDARIVEVFGDLGTADNVAVIVPGITTGIDSYDAGLATHARDVHEATSGRTAVVAHLGYDTPDSLADPATRTGERARDAAPDLAGFIDAVEADGRDRTVTLVGHSYGTRVAAEAARRTGAVDQLVILGSPGTGAETVGELGVDPGDVYIGRNADDPIRHVGTIEDLVTGIGIDPGDLGHGRDPVDDGYGGQLIAVPPTGGHGDYWNPDAGIGRSVVLIVDGRAEEADIAADRGGGTPR